MVLSPSLLCHPPPYEDESLAGYLLRLSERNYYETPNWILQMGHLRANRGFSLLLNPDNNSCLSQLIGLDDEQLLKMAYRTQKQWDKPYYVIYNFAVHLCPICLGESPYCRQLWDSELVRVCPFHKCFLINVCPSCSRKIKWSRPGVTQCQCGFDFRHSQREIASPTQVNFALYIYHSEQCKVELDVFKEAYGMDNPVWSLTLSQFLKLTDLLQSYLDFFLKNYDRIYAGEGIFLQSEEVIELNQYEILFYLFKNWRESFKQIFKYYEIILEINTNHQKYYQSFLHELADIALYFPVSSEIAQYICDYIIHFLKTQEIEKIRISWVKGEKTVFQTVNLVELNTLIDELAFDLNFPTLNLAQLINFVNKELYVFPLWGNNVFKKALILENPQILHLPIVEREALTMLIGDCLTHLGIIV